MMVTAATILQNDITDTIPRFVHSITDPTYSLEQINRRKEPF
jgi:hypothetical protein